MVLLYVLIGIVVLGAAAVSYFVGQQRIRDIRAFAAAHSLDVLGNDWDMDERGFDLFSKGNRRYWRNVLRGTWNGMPVTYCDYSYVVQSGRSSTTYSFSNVIGALGLEIPQVTVSPRGAFGLLAEKTVGAPGIRFESIAFNDRFDVHCDDDSFAIQLIDAQMIETLLGLDQRFHIIFGPYDMMVYAHREAVVEISGLFDATVLVEQRIPALVRSQFGPQQAPPT